jgi:hypothetical protein
MEALVVRQILGMQSSIILPDLGLMQNGKNGGLGEEHGILGPQQLRPPLVEMDQLALMPVCPWGASANREDDGMGAATKSACLNSQVGMTKTAW